MILPLALAWALWGCASPDQDPQPHPHVWLLAPSWVDSAVPLRTTEPVAELDDLEPLRASFDGARVIAIGEATHGSHEFFALRERLLRWSISRLGVRAVAIESSMTEVAELDRYIQGEGRAQRAAQLVTRNSNWPWRTVEFAATLEWLRDHNGGRAPAERVHIYGFDIQQPWVTLEALGEAFAGDEEIVRTLQSADLRRLAVHPDAYRAHTPDEHARTQAALAELEARVRRSPLATPLLMRLVNTLRQVERHNREYTREGVSARRELAMADNIGWIADTLCPHAPLMVWAHDGHISRVPLHPSHDDAMGRHLAQQLGDRFVNVGLLFSRGAFLARDNKLDRQPIHEHSVPPGPPDGLGPRLAHGACPLFFLDLRELPESDPLYAWLSAPRRTWMVGSVVTNPQRQVGEFELLAAFDAIVFVREVSAAELTPGAD